MEKQNVICPYDRILLKNKKEWTNDTCNNTNKPQNIMLSKRDYKKGQLQGLEQWVVKKCHLVITAATTEYPSRFFK